MLFHVDVTADPDEPLVIDPERARAGLAWLKVKLASGTLREALPFEQTGGYMDVRVPAEDEATARAQLDELLDTYPLRSTITVTANVLLGSLDEGFAKLFAAIDERRRINA